MAVSFTVNEAPARAVITLTAAQAVTIARALADAEWYRRDSATAWCPDCATAQGGACSYHISFLAPADAYRDLATDFAHVLKQIRPTAVGEHRGRPRTNPA